MNESAAYRPVETLSRLVHWRIESFGSCTTFRKSDPFKMGKWNWYLSVEKNRGMIIKLYPEISNLMKENPPIASFIIRVVSADYDRKKICHPKVTDQLIRSNEHFMWNIQAPPTTKFIIEVEFLDLKTTSKTTEDDNTYSIWSQGFEQDRTDTAAIKLLRRMLTENIHTDITINLNNAKLKAHRAILIARSPIFLKMFTHDQLKENQLSTTIDINDMSSTDSCKALLNYIYNNIEYNEFVTHRLDLLMAADKYEITDLKEACVESLLDDIDDENVLERLEFGFMYRIPKLKERCLCYLIKFGKIFDMGEDLNDFIQFADRDLIAEMFHEILGHWNGFCKLKT